MEQKNNVPALAAKTLTGRHVARDKRPVQNTLRAAEAEVQLRSFMVLTSDAIISADDRGNIFFWNQGARQMFGYAEDEVLGQPLTMLMPERFRGAYSNGIERDVSAGITHIANQAVEVIGLRKDGSEFPIELTYTPWKIDQKTFLSAIIRDITERKKAEEALRTGEARFRAIVANAPMVLFAYDREGIITFIEGKALEQLHVKPEYILGRSVFEAFHDTPPLIKNAERALHGEKISTRLMFRERIFDAQYVPLFDAQGQVDGIAGVAVDITERVEAEISLRAREKRFNKLTEQADVVLIVDETGVFRYVSPSLQRIVGYTPGDLIGTFSLNLVHPADLPTVQKEFEAILRRDVINTRFEVRVRHANGSWVTLEAYCQSCLDDPDIQGTIINARDITERAIMERQLRYQLEHDTLTNLPNRTLLLARIKRFLQDAKTTQSPFALFVMDLNRFKEINDTFGHQYGDLLLQQVSARLCEVAPPSSTIARLGGDEFALLLSIPGDVCDTQIAATLRALFDKPFTVKEVSLPVDVSIGASLYPDHGSDALSLMRYADIAMYTAKQAHKDYTLYDPSYEQSSARRLALTRDLRYALASHDLVLYYQPKVEIKSGIVLGVEALVRWRHPSYGMVPPDQFIPLAEQTGLINALTLRLLDSAIQQCRSWLDSGIKLGVSVNLSTWNLREPMLPETIYEMLHQYDVPPDLLHLELTESAVMADTERSIEVLNRLSSLGIHVSIDDFGTGYSSLAYLKRLPVEELKIDRSFVMHITEVEADAKIVHSTITMAHSLGLSVVAEGVENQAALDLLEKYDCDLAQGYYLSRPVPAADLEHWLHDKKYRSA